MTTETQLLREAQQAIAALMRGAEKDSDGAWGRIVMPSNAALTAGENVSRAIAAALSAPAQPASGEADTLCLELSASLGCAPSNADVIAAVSDLINTTPPASHVPDGVWEALQRLIENGGSLGPASQEDALVVARYRDRVRFMAPPASQEQAQPSTEGAYTVERHGSGWAIYQGRTRMTHGANLGRLTETTPRIAQLIELALNAASAAQPSGEVVAWRWMPSQVFPEWVYSDDPARVAEAKRFMGDRGVQALTPQTAPQPAARAPLTSAQRRRLWENSKEHHKDAASFTGFERIVTLTERAHGIGGISGNGEG